MKDYFCWRGNSAMISSRDATREAFSKGLVEDGEGWMAMIKSRNLSSHTYNQNVADAIVAEVIGCYSPLLQAFEHRMRTVEAL